MTGMVLDLKELKEILNREIVEPYDHRFLNYEVAAVRPRRADHREYRAGHLAAAGAANCRTGSGGLHAVRVYETPDLFVDYFGESRVPRDAAVPVLGVAPAAFRRN